MALKYPSGIYGLGKEKSLQCLVLPELQWKHGEVTQCLGGRELALLTPWGEMSHVAHLVFPTHLSCSPHTSQDVRQRIQIPQA